MNRIKKIVVPVKNFVSDHKVALAVAVTLTVCTVMQARTVAGLNEFLSEHDLLDEFYGTPA